MRRLRPLLAVVFLCVLIVGLSSPFACAQAKADGKISKELTLDERRELDEAKRLNAQAAKLYQQGQYHEAIKLVENSLEIRKRVLGEAHADYATSLHNLAALYKSMGDYARAEPLYKQALEIKGKALGEAHPDYAACLNNLALLYKAMNDYARAEPLYKQALEIRRKVLGEAHPDYATSLNNLAALYGAMDDYARAEPLLKQALEIRRKVLGEADPDYATSLNNLAVLYDSLGDYARAEPFYKQALEIRRKALGETHPDYAAGLNNLALLYKSMSDYARAEPLLKQALEIRRKVLGEAHPDHATSLNNLASLYKAMNDYARAEPLYKQALEIRRKALGEAHPDYATSLNNLALLYEAMSNYARAEPLYKQAAEIRRKVLGEADPDYASSLNNLAVLYKSMGDYARAEPLYKQALEIDRKALGEAHPHYASCLNNLALLYKAMSDYARAEPLYKQAAEIRREVQGETHPDYATSLNNLALLYMDMGDYARAEPLCKQALEIRRKVPCEAHPDFANVLNNLAALYKDMGDYARAEPLYKQASKIWREVLGETHPDYAISLNNLADLYHSMGDYARAEPLYKQALEIDRKARGDTHCDYASDLNNLALLYMDMGDYARAEPLCKQAAEIRRKVLGETHPDYAASLNNLAALYYAMGDYARAEPCAQHAVQIVRRNLELTSAVQSERQQLSMNERLRLYLDSCLTISAAAPSSLDAVYDEMLAWKGAVSARQQVITQLRRAAGPNEPGVARLYGELEAASRQFATLSRLSPSPEQAPAFRDRLARLSERIEQLEQQLSHASAEFRAQLAQRRRSGAEMTRALPDGAALVDLLEYWHYQPPEKHSGEGTWQRRYVAFILRRDRPIARVDLGAAEPIRLAVLAWRRQFVPSSGEENENDNPGDLPKKPAEVLQNLVWDKLAPHLEGTSTLLVSPDGPLDRFPWAAMPIGEGQYLIEKMAVAVVPVPRMLPEMITRGESIDPEPSLLLVGDVDYGASAGAPAELASSRSAPRERDGKLLQDWLELANTRQEALAVRDSFARRFPKSTVTLLSGAQPTEQHVRETSRASRYLHLATHGYFAPPQLRSALSATQLQPDGPAREFVTRQDVAGFHPGLLSGIVLAGANRPLDPDEDDGVLTALEVAKLDLRGVALVTLSACETGLGETAGGEGVLGLQRAFQTAGAKSVIASLWKVHDQATQQFMVDFYETLWRQHVPTAEALRQTQLKMLRAETEVSAGGQGRGLKLLDEQPPDKQGRLPPYYWAAFVLSGDWR